MKRINPLYLFKGILAFCSIVYELLLAQTMAAFLPHTVLHYCLTIGLYLFSLGIGAWLAERRNYSQEVRVLAVVELGLAALGGFSVVLLHSMGALDIPAALFMAAAYGLVVAIGLMTAVELPFLINLVCRRQPGKEDIVLAWDYAGAMAGSIIFSVVFYNRLGLITSAFLVGLINALAGLGLLVYRDTRSSIQERVFSRNLVAGYGVLSGIFCVCLLYADKISRYLMELYVT